MSFHGAKAGCVVSWVKEETTAELLIHHHFTQQQCQTMFPKHAKIKPAEQARQIEIELREAAKLAPAERDAKLRELDEHTQLLVDSVEDSCGLRLDGTLTHPPSGQQIWYDTTTVHTTCRSKIKKELALHATAGLLARKAKTCSPPVHRAHGCPSEKARPLHPARRDRGAAGP